MRTKLQVSAGGVVYRRRDGVIEFAVALGRGGVMHLPKGLVEPGDTIEATARREVQEETGLTGVNEGKLGEITYWYVAKPEMARIHKTVHFFLFRQTGGSPDDHDWEVDEVLWVPSEEAVARLTYAGEREIAAKAVTALAGR